MKYLLLWACIVLTTSRFVLHLCCLLDNVKFAWCVLNQSRSLNTNNMDIIIVHFKNPTWFEAYQLLMKLKTWTSWFLDNMWCRHNDYVLVCICFVHCVVSMRWKISWGWWEVKFEIVLKRCCHGSRNFCSKQKRLAFKMASLAIASLSLFFGEGKESIHLGKNHRKSNYVESFTYQQGVLCG